MKVTLKPGIACEHRSVVPVSGTVPVLYPEAEEFLAIPEVCVTGFLGRIPEWACIKPINPHFDRRNS